MQKSQMKAKLAKLSDHDKTRLKIALGYEGLRAVGWDASIEFYGEPDDMQRQILDCIALSYADEPAQDWDAVKRARENTWHILGKLIGLAEGIERGKAR